MTDHRDMEGLLGPELRALLSTLPKEIPPERDLTQEIAAQTWDSRERLPGAADIDAEATKRRRQPYPWWSGLGSR